MAKKYEEVKYEDIQVIVGGMRMPWFCYECPLFIDTNRTYYCRALNKTVEPSYSYRPKECPLIPYVEDKKWDEVSQK